MYISVYAFTQIQILSHTHMRYTWVRSDIFFQRLLQPPFTHTHVHAHTHAPTPNFIIPTHPSPQEPRLARSAGVCEREREQVSERQMRAREKVREREGEKRASEREDHESENERERERECACARVERE